MALTLFLKISLKILSKTNKSLVAQNLVIKKKNAEQCFIILRRPALQKGKQVYWCKYDLIGYSYLMALADGSFTTFSANSSA